MMKAFFKITDMNSFLHLVIFVCVKIDIGELCDKL